MPEHLENPYYSRNPEMQAEEVAGLNERRVQIMPDGSKIYPPGFSKMAEREQSPKAFRSMSYEDFDSSLSAVHDLLREHKLAVESEDEGSLAHCLQVEGRMYERLRFLADGVLRLER